MLVSCNRMLAQSIYFAFLLVGTVTCFSQSRILNGTDSFIEYYPFAASLRVRNEHICGATLIACNWVLTAAHCTNSYRSDPSVLTIQYRQTFIESEGTMILTVKRVIVHENYDPTNNYANDISVLKLNEKVNFNFQTFRPAYLPIQGLEMKQIPEGTPGIVIGWGSSIAGGPLETRLKEIDLKIYSDEECNSRYNGKYDKDYLCAGVEEEWRGYGQCRGDSGGPLLYKKYIQVGIATWSNNPCTKDPNPGVFTKVSHYTDWIRSHGIETQGCP